MTIYVLFKTDDYDGAGPLGYYTSADKAKAAAGPSPESWEDKGAGCWYRSEHRGGTDVWVTAEEQRRADDEYERVHGHRPLLASTSLGANAEPTGYWRHEPDENDPYVEGSYIEAVEPE